MNITNSQTTPAVDIGSAGRMIRALPPLAALAYPGLIWCGAALTPIFLLLSIAVPGVALWVAHRTGSHPRARWIAFFAVGTPPLYSLLGGWLDWQHAVPFKGLHVWMVLWAVLACVALWEQPSEERNARAHAVISRRLAFAHGISAALITCFALAHLFNHFTGLWGGDVHLAVMKALRLAYRQPFVEAVLLAAIAFQVSSGVVLLSRKLARAGSWIDSLQMGSAAYLVVFFLSHLSAVLRARYLRNVDTNWVWLTSDNLLTDPWSVRLTPYYFLAIIAFGVHGAVGVRSVMMSHGNSMQRADRAFGVIVAAATVLSAAIMVGLVGSSIH
jgi:succinate dehydrogenase/fumarate reductase cytochrome b subunit